MKTANNAWMVMLLFVLGLALPACEDDESEDSSMDGDSDGDTEAWDGVCTEETDGYEKCEENRVQWCHVLEGMDPHFHEGANCETLGYECIQLSGSEAACLDTGSYCTVGEFKCEENTAYNCADYDGQGHWAIEPCGTVETCTLDTTAFCEQAESTFDPQDACEAMTGESEETKSVVTVFDDVFSENSHLDLGERVHLTLPDNQISYIHFPVFSCGEYAVFLDQAGVFDAIQHRDQSEMTVSGGVAVELCSDDIADHWHVDVEWDGDGTEGVDPVPFVLRFKAIEGGTDLHVVMFQTAAED